MAASVVLASVLHDRSRASEPGPRPVAGVQTGPTRGALEISTEGAPYKGNGDAEVVIVEFSDFECTFCARHARQTFPRIERAYLSAGTVKYVFRHLPRRGAARIHKAAECAAARGAFWQAHEALFKRSDRTADPLEVIADILRVGIDEVERCAMDPRHVAAVQQDFEVGQGAGITGTPAFFIGRAVPGSSRVVIAKTITGAKPFSVFEQLLDGLLRTAAPR